MLRKLNLYKEAIFLRKKGYSYTEILELVPVSNGTISRWCRNIILTEQQKERLVQKKRDTILIKTLIKQAKKSRQDAYIWAKQKIKEMNFNNKDDILLIAGVLLYWAEGNKFNENGHKEMGFTNTDSRMIKIMISFLEKIMGISKNKIRVVVRIGKQGNTNKAIQYWSNITKIPIINFNKPELIILTEKSRSLEKYPYGMCRIVVNNTSLSRRINSIISELFKSFIINKVIKN